MFDPVLQSTKRWMHVNFIILMVSGVCFAAVAVAGRLVWSRGGEIDGQVTGGSIGATAWAAWRLNERRKSQTPHSARTGPQRIKSGGGAAEFDPSKADDVGQS
jgi:hypothetical protein